MRGDPDRSKQKHDTEQQFGANGGDSLRRGRNGRYMFCRKYQCVHGGQRHGDGEDYDEDRRQYLFHPEVPPFSVYCDEDNAEVGRSTQIWLAQCSPQARPIVSHKDRVNGICRIVLDAGRLAGDQPLKTHLALQPGNVLAGLIGHT